MTAAAVRNLGESPYLMGYMGMLLPATIDSGVAILCRGDIERYKRVPKI